jgi:hypothetical protein
MHSELSYKIWLSLSSDGPTRYIGNIVTPQTNPDDGDVTGLQNIGS